MGIYRELFHRHACYNIILYLTKLLSVLIFTTGVLILIGLIIVTVFVCLRMRKKKTPLPRNMMGPVNRMSRHFGHTGWSLDDEESPPPYPGTLQKGDDNESKQGKGNMVNNRIGLITLSTCNH